MAIVIFWFRRDLRLTDNVALHHAMADGRAVLPLFIFDTDILGKLSSPADDRVAFIHQALSRLNQTMNLSGSALLVEHGSPARVWEDLLQRFEIGAVYANHDYEPYARRRDEMVGKLLKNRGIPFNTYKDQVIFEKEEITKDDGKPYTVFTPYSRKWRARLTENPELPVPLAHPLNWAANNTLLPTLAQIGFRPTGTVFPDAVVSDDLISRYGDQRDFPALEGTSRLGIHLRFGTLSIRELLAKSQSISTTFVNELIWRDFYQMILWHFPHVESASFKPAYDQIEWLNDEALFDRWKSGDTGYPLVDAGMRQLAATGWMHNRVRMVVASFLAKHLLTDWRWGEAWFAEKLNDYELASNNGGWQWAAGSGCDAAPYFRVFSPLLQAQKFDPKGAYIARWVPEAGLPGYLKPIVDHPLARERAIRTYKAGLERRV